MVTTKLPRHYLVGQAKKLSVQPHAQNVVWLPTMLKSAYQTGWIFFRPLAKLLTPIQCLACRSALG